MSIEFTQSTDGTLGIEWEVSLVDTTTRELASRAPEVLERIQATKDGPLRGEYLSSIVELVTGVHTSVPDAIGEIRELLARLCEVAADVDCAVIGSGTHPFTNSVDVPIASSHVYDVVRDRNAWWGQRMTICGTHIHLGVADREHAIALVRRLAETSPLLIALAASSPYFEGADTGFASQRTMLFQQLATNGLPPFLHSWEEFEERAAQMQRVGMSETPSDLRWDVRPAPAFGTVELRAADSTTTLDELGCIAAWTQCIGADLIGRLKAGLTTPTLPRWIVAENKWRAARYGLDADVITPDGVVPLRTMAQDALTRYAPLAERLGCADEFAFTEQILRQGASADRQRQTAARTDGDLRAVVDDLILQTRGDL